MFSDVNSCTCRRVGPALAPWILLALLAPAVAPAANPTPYGESFVRAGQSWADGEPGQARPGPSAQVPETGRDHPVSAAVPADRAAYLRQVEAAELAAGPYASALAEPLEGLARYHRQQGDIAAAQRLYVRALHVVRINHGLASRLQVPMVRALLDTYREVGDMEALDQRYDYFFRLYGSGQPPYTDLRTRATLEYLRWQREALRLSLDGRDNRRLLNLYRLNQELLETAQAREAIPYAWHRDLVLSQIRNLYLLLTRITPKAPETGPATFSPVRGPGAVDPLDQPYHERRLEGLHRSAPAAGTTLLEQLLARAGREGPAEAAAAELELGDWLQWNGSQSRAAGHYASVVRRLLDAGEIELARDWFDQPRELPDNGAFWQPRSPRESDRRVRVSASFDVSASGRVGNIVARPAREEERAFAWQLKRALARTRFRPRYADGVPQAVVQMAVDYEMLD